MTIIAFPVNQDQGLDSAVHGHFGSAPYFLFVDLDTHCVETVVNPDRDHDHGACDPLSALGGRRVDGVAVGGIGGGALKKLHDGGIAVYRAVDGTVGENARLIKSGTLPLFDVSQVCGHHHGVQIGSSVK